METSKSDYRFKFIDDVLVIEDLNLGRMSVTNNAEDVISEIRKSTDRRLTEHFIIYKDSEGIWDQIIPSYSLRGCSEVFLSDEFKNKVSEGKKGIKFSDEHKKNYQKIMQILEDSNIVIIVELI